MEDTRTIPIELPETAPQDYDVVIGAGVLDRLPDLLPARASAARYALISDDTVLALHGDRLLATLGRAGRRATGFSVPPGEAEKTRARWAGLTDELVEAGFGRDSTLIALGGGVVGDLAGFVAATFMRGVPFVQAPTTLLAMVDASVGGKTGVDTPHGKNLVGVIRQPVLVAADPRVLRTLPMEQLRAGLAEAVKHGAIADAAYLDWIEAEAQRLFSVDVGVMSRLIARSVEIKASFAARDPEERGPRKALNFGHTIGHAIEALSGYELGHGQAVAIGMVAEAELGEAVGLTVAGTAARLRAVLRLLGLPTTLPERVTAGAIVAQARRDKKVRRARTRYTLISRLGDIARSEEGDWSIALEEPVVEGVLSRSRTV